MKTVLAGRNGPSLRNQRGVATIVTVIFLTLSVVFLALVIDTGRLYYERRSLQRVADMAALDAANQAGLCSVTGVTALSAAQASAGRNGYTQSLSTNGNAVNLGFMTSGADGLRVFTADATRAEAVEVIVKRDVPASIVAGGLFGGSATLSARAVAQRKPVASFSVGSGLLTLNSGSSPLLGPILGGLLGSGVNVAALSYDGIAGANIQLLDFLKLVQAKVGLGSPQDVLTTDVSAVQVVRAVADAMATSSNSGVLNVASSLTGGSLAKISGATVNLGQLLGLQAGAAATDAQLHTMLNTFDLLMATAVAANGTNSVALGLSAPNLAGASLRIIEKPQIALGMPGKDNSSTNPDHWRTYAKTGQLSLLLNLNPNLNLAGAKVQTDIALKVGLAQGQGWLKSVSCSTLANPNSLVTIGAHTATDSLQLVSAANPNNPASLTVKLEVGALSVTIVSANIAAGGAGSIVGENSRDLSYTVVRQVDANDKVTNTITPSATQRISSNVGLSLPPLSVSNVNIANLGLLNLVVKALLDTLGGALALLNSVVSALSTAVISPLLSALGIQLGYSDVMLIDVNTGRAELVN